MAEKRQEQAAVSQQEHVPSDVPSRFSLLDVIRVLAGVVLVNAVLSWYFTTSTTWGYEGKLKDLNYWKFKWDNGASFLTLTEQELALYNGTDPSLPIYVAINGSVYDVTHSKRTYGPLGRYAFFTGKDAARAYVTGCFTKPDEFTHDLRGLDEDEATADIQQWQSYYDNHRFYWYVGQVSHGPLTGDPPAFCAGMKFPSAH